MDKRAIFLILLFILPLVTPIFAVAHAQQMSIAISPSHGPVGINVTVTGTIETYNGDYEIYFDTSKVAEGTANGYNVEKTIQIPNAYAGSHQIVLKDVNTGHTATAIFTLESTFKVEATARAYEGGAVTVTVTIIGGGYQSAAWNDDDNNGKSDANVRLRIVGPDGSEISALTVSFYADETATTAKYQGSHAYGPGESNLVKHGTYTVYVDVDIDEDGSFGDNEKGLASTTFVIGLVDKTSVQRTDTVHFRAYIPNGKTGDKYVVIGPDGSTVATIDVTDVTGPGFLDAGSWSPAKDATLGTYKVEVILTDGSVLESESFSVTRAAFTIEFTDGPTGNEDKERTLTVAFKFYVKYPDGSYATSNDITSPFTVSIFYNTTKVADITLDPMVSFEVSTSKWVAEWKIPKDAKLGINYCLNVTANAITDQYGNVGPEEYASSYDSNFKFKVVIATLTVTTPNLVYPSAGQTLQRTLVAKASFQVKYPDNSLFTADDAKWVNVTVTGPETFTLTLSPEDYNPDTGLWVIKWKIPWNATTGAYQFKVCANKVEDKWGNKGPSADTGTSSSFNVGAATLTIADFTTDKTEYETGETIVVTFRALYPSGDEVTTGSATIKVYKGTTLKTSVTASYDTDLKKWYAEIDTSGWSAGSYNVTLEADALHDDTGTGTDNTGPAATLRKEISVIKVQVIDVEVVVGSTHFPGEAVNFYVYARYRGAPFDLPADAIKVTIYRPDGVADTSATVSKVSSGLFRIDYVIPKNAPFGGYAVEVKVNYKISTTTYARGYGVKSFSVNPVFTSWNASIANIDLIVTELAGVEKAIANLAIAVDAGFKDVLTKLDSISGGISDIKSSLSSISSAISSLSSKLDSVASSLSSKLDSVKSALSSAISGVSSKLDSISSAISGVSSAIKSLKCATSDEVSAVGSKVSSVASAVGDLSKKVDTLSSDVSSALSSLSGLVTATAVLVIITLIVAAVATFKVFRA